MGRRRFALALLLVALGLTVFFYVFQVVYPQPDRFTPVPHEVFLLDEGNPEAAAILSRVQDVDYLIMPSPEAVGEGVSLENRAPVFHPSYERHELTLQDIPHRPFVTPPTRLLDPDEAVLPPLDLLDLKTHNEKAAGGKTTKMQRLVLKFHGMPTERLPKTMPDFSEIPLVDPEGCQFQLGVDAFGQVIFALPLSTNEEPGVVRLVAERLRRLRFEAIHGAATLKQQQGVAPLWSRVTFHWSSES